MAKNVSVTKGTEIHLVLANGQHTPAKVTNVRKGDLVDLEAEVGDATVAITSSPLDELGKKADSWHLPEQVVEAEPAK